MIIEYSTLRISDAKMPGILRYKYFEMVTIVEEFLAISIRQTMGLETICFHESKFNSTGFFSAMTGLSGFPNTGSGTPGIHFIINQMFQALIIDWPSKYFGQITVSSYSITEPRIAQIGESFG